LKPASYLETGTDGLDLAFHAVQSAKELLVKAGFQEIKVRYFYLGAQIMSISIISLFSHRKKTLGLRHADLVESII
jgi:hypothetical protein